MAHITEYTDPDVLTIGVKEGWADPITDPTQIDWEARQATAAIPFKVENGRPVNPVENTIVGRGRNKLGHWGETKAADAIVTIRDIHGCLWIAMIEREDSPGYWALPGGMLDPGETPFDAGPREMREETGLRVARNLWAVQRPRYVPDPRASREAWIVTYPCLAFLGWLKVGEPFPLIKGMDDASKADWVPAISYEVLEVYLGGLNRKIYPAHVGMLKQYLALH